MVETVICLTTSWCTSLDTGHYYQFTHESLRLAYHARGEHSRLNDWFRLVYSYPARALLRGKVTISCELLCEHRVSLNKRH